MIFEYDELKECVTEDFEQFLNRGFNEKQIYPAVINEYEHGKDFCQVECICIHLFLILNYIKREMNYELIAEKLEVLLASSEADIESDLGNQYKEFLEDIMRVREK